MAKLFDITGKAISGEWGSDDENGNGTPVLRTTNFTNSGIVDFTNVVTRNIGKKNVSSKYLRHGDIIIEKSGGSDKQPVGRVVFFEGPESIYLFNNFTGLLRVKDQQSWLPRFVFYALYANYRRGGTKQYENRTTGLHNLQTDIYIESVCIPDVTFEKQQEICAALDSISSIISTRNNQLKLIDELVKARFVELFGDPKYNKSNLVKIGEIGALTSGGTPSRAKPEYFEGDIRWYSAGELNSLYLADSIEHISETALQESSAKLFDKGTLLIGMYDTAAFKMGILTENASSNQACANLNPKQGYNIVWLYYLFDMMKPIFLQERQGVRQKNLSLSKIKEFEIPVAPFELQEEFAAFVEQTDKSKAVVQKALDEAQSLFDSLMQQYFGEKHEVCSRD